MSYSTSLVKYDHDDPRVSDGWSVSLCVQQVEDELSSPVVLFKFSQEMSAGKGHTPGTPTNMAESILIKSLYQSETVVEQ